MESIPNILFPEILDNKINILYSGRLGYRKGLVDLVKSAEIYYTQSSGGCLLLTGRGPLEGTLKNLVAKNVLRSTFSFWDL